VSEMDNMYCKCPYFTVQHLLSGKWSLLILCYLRSGTMRFGELRRCLEDVGDITQATLTKALRKLETDGLIVRQVFAEVPPHVEYSLSELGQELSPILQELGAFGVRYIEQRGEGSEICSEYEHTCRCCKCEDECCDDSEG